MAVDLSGSEVGTMRPALTVSGLNRAVSGLLERSFPLVRVRGEIANFSRAASGHWYFALKDSTAQVRCVMFRARSQLLDWAPREGDDVEVNAVVSMYEARGEFQLSVEFMRRSGQGRLYEEFLRLKARLADEGLFALERKRSLPRIPRRVAVVTSLQAAALADLLTTLCRRAPYVSVIVYPVSVQGASAGGDVADMLRRVSRRAHADGVEVLLLVRGGGSIEDLWAFNQEVVARAIVSCLIPVVVGVGHESDVTIADFAADLRAPTPTAAAELVAPTTADLIAEFRRHFDRLKRGQLHRLQSVAQRLDYMHRSLASPRMPVAALESRVHTLRSRLARATVRALGERRARVATQREWLLRMRLARVGIQPAERLAGLAAGTWRRWNASSTRLTSLAARLHAIDPHAVLARGYSIVIGEDGRAVVDAETLRPGADLLLVLARGQAQAQVRSVLPIESPIPSASRPLTDKT
ncbi:MAG: exodeoxyribonuclease VII large subunit [Burkholderiaceae bacterium]